MEAFAKEAGIKLNHIPAQGGASVITALLGGHVDMAVQDIVTGLPHVKAGTLRPLGIFSTKRIRALPNYPTIAVARTSIHAARAGIPEGNAKFHKF